MTVGFYADHVDHPGNRAGIERAAALLGATCVPSVSGRLIAVENADSATSVYGRRPLAVDATIALGNERRGLSQRLMDTADETVAIPTESPTVKTLNVAAAAAVAGWYLLRGSGPQPVAARPALRRPAILLSGDDHVEVGSSLRSSAAFGFREVLLEDRGAGWFHGPAGVRREARAAARRFKNPLLVRPASVDATRSYEWIILVTRWGPGAPLARVALTRGARQLVVVGVDPQRLLAAESPRVTVASLGLQPSEPVPLRLVASIVLAEIARQVGRRGTPARPWRGPRFQKALALATVGEGLLLDGDTLLQY